MIKPVTRRMALALALVAPLAHGASGPEPYADAVLQHVQQTTGVPVGSGQRVVDVFFDPNCPYCHTLFDALKPWVGKQGLEFVWIPVGVLAPSSGPKAAAILQAQDRVAALERNERDYDLNPQAGSGGGIVPAKQVDATTRAVLARNKDVLQLAGPYFAFPLMVWRDKSGHAQMFLGAPRDDTQVQDMLATVR